MNLNFKELLGKLQEKKYLLLLLVLGIAIMLIPGKAEERKSEKGNYINDTVKVETNKLEKMLKEIKGVKSCDILVTYDNQGENNFVYDVSSGNNRQLEVKLSNNEPLIKSVNNPKIRGIFVNIKGKTINSNEIMQIVKAATGTPLHRIYIKISEGE